MSWGEAQSLPVFPTEIFESIICNSSHSTLLKTASVNSTFHCMTRKHLFKFISLKRTVFDRDTVSRARTFLSLLDHIPELAKCVRRIHIDCFGERLSQSSPISNGTPLIEVLSRLTRLKSISLTGTDGTNSTISWLDWKQLCVELSQAFVYAFRSPLICEIKLSHFYNLPLSIFAGCHSLKHLSLTMISPEKSLPSQNDIGSRPELKSLVLRRSFTDIHDQAKLEWLFSPQGLFNIAQLDKFVHSGEGSHEQLARILSLGARSIKSLELKMDNIARNSNAAPLVPLSPINLDILSNLTQLIIVAKLLAVDMDMDVDTDGTRRLAYSSPLPWLVACLEMLTPASNLTEIILQLNLSVADTILKAVDWVDLVHILSSENLPNLIVTLKVSGEYTPLSPTQWAVLRNNRYLSPLVAHGRLVLVNSRPL